MQNHLSRREDVRFKHGLSVKLSGSPKCSQRIKITAALATPMAMYIVMYMLKKIRKQIYIDPEQERLLKKSAKRTGLTEAQIIRNAIDLGIGSIVSFNPHPDVWGSEVAFIRKWMKKGSVRGGRSWKRDDLHER
jgi:hypothetical protein